MTDTTPKPPPKLYPIPSGARARPCDSTRCGMTLYLVKNADTGKWMPLSPDTPGGVVPTALEDGLGCIHFANCVDWRRFRR